MWDALTFWINIDYRLCVYSQIKMFKNDDDLIDAMGGGYFGKKFFFNLCFVSLWTLQS